jgi:putative membrane protein insertion efficiency factor
MSLDSRLDSARPAGGLRPLAARWLGGAPQSTPPTTSCDCENSCTGYPSGVVAHLALPRVVHSVVHRTHRPVAGNSRPYFGTNKPHTGTPMTPLHKLWTRCAQRCAQAALRAIEWYQDQRATAVSPCRFFPSCSEYSHEAISVHGIARGLWLTVRRLSRCRPFGPSGFDPVPEPAAATSFTASSHAQSKEHRHV